MRADFYNVAVIGAGELGSRHLQALALLERPIKFFVVDPSNESLRIAKERFQQVCSIEQRERVNFLVNVEDLKENIDIAIVATNANDRREVLEKLLNKITIRQLILEKVVFQSVEDFEAINHLLQQKQIPAWVNCPNRLFPFYQNLKKKINLDSPISFQVSGGNWGLGCNSIHYLDLFAFLTGTSDIHLFGGGLHSGTIDSKREGYKEFTGTLLGTTEKGDQLTFCSLPENEAPLLIQIMTSQERYILSESDQKALSSTKDGQWKWEVEEFNILYQSQLTHLVVEEIFEKGNCSLTSLEESYVLHKTLLNVLLKHVNKFSEQIYTHCPIT